MTITVPDFGQAQITCGGVKLVFQGPNHLPTCLVKDENDRRSKTNDKKSIYTTHNPSSNTPKNKQQKQMRGN